MKRLAAVLLASAAMTGAAFAQNVSKTGEWATYGQDRGGQRFSTLNQITPANVAGLKPAWTYKMKPADFVVPSGGFAGFPGGGGGPGGQGGGPGGAPGAGAPPVDSVAQQAAAEGVRPAAAPPARPAARFLASEATPLVVGGVMYLATPYGNVVALDPTSGKEIWNFKLPSGAPATRGVEYFAGDRTLPAQIVVATTDAKLFTLDAKTGALNTKFGANGIVDLNTPEILKGYPGNNGLSSPPIMYRDLIIIGGRTTEAGGPGPAGDVRAFDIKSGKLVWTFHSIPQPGEFGHDTWAPDSWKNRSGVNVWGLMTVDTQRGIVYMPFGAPSSDRYGGDRHGDNLFSSSIVAADAKTGKYLWHFQLIKHDIFDYDLQSAPVLLDVKQGGKTIPAVAVINKVSLLYLFDRVTGKPIYGVEDRPVPQSEIPLEKSSATQPFPLKPPPVSRMTMSAADIATVTPEHEAFCKKLIEGVQLGGPFMPNGYNRLSLQFPGAQGGANWGGMSFSPQLGYLFVNTNELGQLQGVRDLPPGQTAPRSGAPYAQIPGGGRFKDTKTNMMCQQPPWGQLTAINVNTGEFAWQVPLGVTESLPADKQNTGRPNNGGPIVTAGGLVFIAATDDSRFRAFDAKTGKEVWSTKLPAVAHAVPMTFRGKDGKQYVVITATGGGFLEAPTISDEVIAYALP